MNPFLLALLALGLWAQGQTPSPQKTATEPYNPAHKVPPGLHLTPEQIEQLAPLLPQPGTPDAVKMVERNKAGIEKIAGKDGYKKIHDWERQRERPTPGAK